MIEDEMVGGHHRLYGHEFEQTLGDGEGQGSLACHRPWAINVLIAFAINVLIAKHICHYTANIYENILAKF